MGQLRELSYLVAKTAHSGSDGLLLNAQPVSCECACHCGITQRDPTCTSCRLFDLHSHLDCRLECMSRDSKAAAAAVVVAAEASVDDAAAAAENVVAAECVVAAGYVVEAGYVVAAGSVVAAGGPAGASCCSLYLSLTLSNFGRPS